MEYIKQGPVKVKVNQFHYRPGQAQKFLRKLRFPDFVTKAQDVGTVVSFMHRPTLPSRNTPGTHFCYTLSRQKAIVRSEVFYIVV